MTSNSGNAHDKHFCSSDWLLFKRIADYYLKVAATLRIKDLLNEPPHPLLIRNIQKRLLLGLGVELLLKALYLKQGFRINQPTKGKKSLAYKFSETASVDFQIDRSLMLGQIIEHLGEVKVFSDKDALKKGLSIAKEFRNKEGHVVTAKHPFDPDDYTAIEDALRIIYAEGFAQNLEVKIGMLEDDIGQFALNEA